MATSHPHGSENLINPEPKAPGGYGHGHNESDVVLTGPTHGLAYEPDQFAVKTILVVPAAVIATAFVAFVVTWIAFATIFDPRKNNPEATIRVAEERNGAPMNERFGRISSTDPNAEVPQPRLEGLQQKQVYYKDGNPENKDPSNLITSEYITTQPTARGNSPRIHAEDLLPGKVRELTTYGQNPETGVARMPVDKAIELAAGGGLLQAQPGARPLDLEPAPDRPKESNGGHGRTPEPTSPAPSAKKGPDDKKEPEKKEAEKKAPDTEKK